MSKVLLWAAVALDGVVFLGLVVRGRLLTVVSFSALLILLTSADVLAGLCPECITWEYWAAKESAHAVLVLGLGLELLTVVFQADARLRRAAWSCAAFVGLALLASLAAAPPSLRTPGPLPFAVALLPRLAAATAVLFAGLTVLMILGTRRGTIDPDDLPRTLLSGFAVYTMLYATTWSRTGDDTTIAGLVNPLVFNLVMVLVLRAVWQRPPPTL